MLSVVKGVKDPQPNSERPPAEEARARKPRGTAAAETASRKPSSTTSARRVRRSASGARLCGYGYAVIRVPVSPLRPAAAHSSEVMRARPAGWASRYSMQASTLGSMLPAANCPSAM